MRLIVALFAAIPLAFVAWLAVGCTIPAGYEMPFIMFQLCLFVLQLVCFFVYWLTYDFTPFE